MTETSDTCGFFYNGGMSNEETDPVLSEATVEQIFQELARRKTIRFVGAFSVVEEDGHTHESFRRSNHIHDEVLARALYLLITGETPPEAEEPDEDEEELEEEYEEGGDEQEA